MKLIDKVQKGAEQCSKGCSTECPYHTMGIDTYACVKQLTADFLEAIKQERSTGMQVCFHCGARAVIWGADFSYEDYGMDGNGIIHSCHCTNCGAAIEYYCPIEDEEGQNE